MASGEPNQSNELLSYIGFEISALLRQGYSPSQTKHLVSSQLVECIMKTVAIKTDGEYDFYAIKPLFIALKYLIDNEIIKEQADKALEAIAAAGEQGYIIGECKAGEKEVTLW